MIQLSEVTFYAKTKQNGKNSCNDLVFTSINCNPHPKFQISESNHSIF